jgi:hypothetical protein
VAGCGESASSPDTDWREAFDAQDDGWLLSTWGTERNSRYAVGGTLERGVILHFDGHGWRHEDISRNTPLLNWVHGFGEDNLIAVGNNGAILRFDGTEWRTEDSPTGENLWGVWGAKPSALWAVGGSGRPGASPTLLFFDGSEWTEQALPRLKRDDIYSLFKVWGTSKDNVFVAGQKGTFLHYDGKGWSQVELGATDDLIAIWGTGPDDVVVVGGRGTGLLSHYDGKRWATQSLFGLPGINGVWMRTPGVAHLAMAGGTLAKWTLGEDQPEHESFSDSLDFHGVFGVDGQVTAVGGNFEAFGATGLQGIAYERNLAPGE